MDIMFLLVPLSVVLALVVMGLLAWAVWTGQFDDLESEGERIFAFAPEEGHTPAVNASENAPPQGAASVGPAAALESAKRS